MLNLNINNETDQLKVVLIGIASDFGGTPLIENAFDPTSKKHIKEGTYPEEKNLIYEFYDDIYYSYSYGKVETMKEITILKKKLINYVIK